MELFPSVFAFGMPQDGHIFLTCQLWEKMLLWMKDSHAAKPVEICALPCSHPRWKGTNAVTKTEIFQKMETMREVFDVVRLVDVTKAKIVRINNRGEVSEEEYRCFSIWNRQHRCDNCVSIKAFAAQKELTKFEFQDDQVFFILARYVVVDDMPYVLELGKLVNDNTLFGAHGKGEFIDKIISYNKKIYHDALTDCYNRRYYDEQLAGARDITAVAVLDIDNFKDVNDQYGHGAGDDVLKAVSAVLIGNVRAGDSVIRMGGDEFVIAFQSLPGQQLYARLNALRALAEQISIPAHPELRITVSIGGVSCDRFGSSILRAADELLYRAKKSRNTVAVETADPTP